MPRGGRSPLPCTMDRLKSKAQRVGGCLLWTAGTAGRGGRYGLVSVNGRQVLAHRVSYELAHGAIPEGYEVDHLCSNPLCVEPTHLEAVPAAENKRRTWQRGRGRNGQESKAACPAGHAYDRVRTRGDGRVFRACSRCERAAQERLRERRMSVGLG